MVVDVGSISEREGRQPLPFFTVREKTMEDNEEEELNIDPVSPEELLESIKSGAEVYSHITTGFAKEFLFYDKTLYEWSLYFMIDLPSSKDLTPDIYRDLYLEIGTKTQIASNYASVAQSMQKSVSSGNKMKRADIIRAIVDGYASRGAKRPSGAILEQMADSYLKSTVTTRVAAEIVADFWKQRLEILRDLRKILEQVGMSLHVEMKHLSS